jgi:cold shock protein
VHQGIVRRFCAERGFGFIAADDGSDIFFHCSAILSSATPRVDQRVSYDVGASKDGRPRAERVRLI